MNRRDIGARRSLLLLIVSEFRAIQVPDGGAGSGHDSDL